MKPQNTRNISTFSLGLITQQVLDSSSIYTLEVRDITEQTPPSGFPEGVRTAASVYLQIGYPAPTSVSQSVISGYPQVLALSVETEHTLQLDEKAKAFVPDPFALLAAVHKAATIIDAPPTAPAARRKAEAKQGWGRSDEAVGFGL